MTLNPNKILDPNYSYKNDGSTPISDELIVVSSQDVAIPLRHDNATEVVIYTQLNKTGIQIVDFTVSNNITNTWIQEVRFGATTRSSRAGETLYVSYVTAGEMVDAEMVQAWHDAIADLQNEVSNFSSGQETLISSTIPADEAIDISKTQEVKIIANKWLKKNQENKLKGYSDVDCTQEVSGTVVRTEEDELTWSPSSPLNYSSMYYFKALSGLQGVDGVAMTSDYIFNFLVQNAPPNVAPTFTSVTVSGTTNLGDTLTMALNGYADADGDLAGTHTKRWLRNDVAITSATNTTYAIQEADLGRTINAEGTPVALTGTSPGTPVLSTDLVIPIPAPPPISVSAGNAQTTTTWTPNSTLSTETYNLYWSTTTGVTKSNGTKITNVTSPYVHTGRTNGTAYYYVLVMEVNGVESAESTQQSGTPVANVAPTFQATYPKTVDGSITATGWRIAFKVTGNSGSPITDADGDSVTTKLKLDAGSFATITPTWDSTNLWWYYDVTGQSAGLHTYQINISDATFPAGTDSAVINQGTNMLANFDFEGGNVSGTPSNWILESSMATKTISVETTEIFGGTKSVKMTGTYTSYGIHQITQEIAVTAGLSYKFDTMLKGLSNGGGVKARVVVAWNDSSHVAQSYSDVFNAVPPSTWQRKGSITVTAPAGAAYASIKIGLEASSATDATLYIDNASFCRA